jgi:two-component system response regulator AlgR
MLVLVDGNLIRLPIDEVLYFSAGEKYIFALTPTRTLKFESSLDALEREFPSVFLRVHRKFLVRRTSVNGLIKIDGSLFVDIAGASEPIPVSRREKPQVRKWFRSEA